MCLVGAVASFLVFPPHHDEASRPFSVHGFLHNAHLFDDGADDGEADTARADEGLAGVAGATGSEPGDRIEAGVR